MNSKIKSILSFGFVALFIVSLFASLAIGGRTPKVYAAPEGYGALCVPPTTLVNGVGYKPNGWLSLEIINRAQIKITITPTGNCANQNRTMDSVMGESPGAMKALLEEVLMDINIGDDKWGYRSFVDGFDGDSIRDQTYLDYFDDGAISSATKDPFGGHSKSVGNIQSAFLDWSKTPQVAFGFEPEAFVSTVGDAAKPIGIITTLKCEDNGNIALFDAGGYKWDCTSNTGDKKGVIVGGTFKNIENFNIVLVSSADATKLTNVSKNLKDSESYTWCGAENFTQPNGEKGRYRTNCADTNNGLYLEGPNANPKSMLENTAKNLIEVTVKKQGDNNPGYKTSVAGSTSGSAEASNAGGAGAGAVGSVDGDDEPGCEASGFSLSWILCPIINGLTSMSQGIFSSIIEPYLKSDPISTDNDSDNITYIVWSSFRTLGNIVLMFGLLFIVFGQAYGGGMMDAYTAKKAIPRILLVAILINLSIYLVAIMIDITNILGAGIGALITAPLKGSGNYNFSIGVGTTGTLGAVVGVSALAIFLFDKIRDYKYPKLGPPAPIDASTTVSGGGFMQFFLLFVLLPVALVTISIFATLIIRRGLIMFLVIIAPVALAMYCLPQTEKYAKKWFDTLIKTLAVYPIIVAIFAIAYVLSLTIIGANGGASEGTFSQFLGKIVGLIVLFVPLAMIPFAFKFAGGTVGALYGAITGAAKKGSEALKGHAQDPSSLRNRVKRNAGESLARTRASYAHANRDLNSRRGLSRSKRMLGRMADLGNVDRKLSMYNAEAAKRKEELSSTGDDALIYAAGGYEEGGEFFNSKHKKISEQTYRKGKQLYGTGNAALAQALEYQLRKAQTDEDVSNFRTAFGKNAIANDWSQDEAMNAWAAATYPHKDKFASEWYSTPSITKDTGGKTTGVGFEDVSSNVGNYAKMVGDVHKVRESFKYSSLRGTEWRAMAQNVSQFEQRLDSGGSYTQEELQNYVMTKEIFNAAGTKFGQNGVNPDGEVSVNGPSAESQAIIKNSIDQSGYVVGVNPGNGDYRDVSKIVTTPPAAGSPLGTRPTTALNPIVSTRVGGDEARSAITRSVT